MARFGEGEARFAAEAPKAIQPVSRVRRIIGLCLVLVGILVISRDLWLGVFFGSEFGGQERIRFVFLLWTGAVLAMAGCWLALKLRAALWALFIVAALLPLLACSYGRWWS
jgi:hypothetical protein